MKNNVFVIIIVTLVFLLTACLDENQDRPVQIEGQTWSLATYNDTLPIVGHQPTLKFETDLVSGTTGCNHYGSSYQIKGNNIQFDGIYSTEMACQEPAGLMDQERIYLELLRSAERFELSKTEDVLTIFASEHQILTFKVKKDDVSISVPPQEQPTLTPTDIVVEPTLTQVLAPQTGFKEYRDSVIGVSVYIPESWVVAEVNEGDYAIFQSYPEDKYVGGEGRDPEDTKCDLNIQLAGTSVGELIQQWESDELTTIVSEEEIILPSGLIGQWFVIESMGQSVAFVTEINKRAVVLNCFGNPEPFEEIFNTLSEFEVAFHDPEGNFKQYQDSETGVTLDVPGSWAITEVIPGVKATLQSLETTCELFIRSDISSVDEVVTPMKSNEDINITSEDQIVLNTGQPATRLEINIEMDNIGQSMLVITEINEKVIVFNCVGDFSTVDEIASTLQVLE